MVIAAKQKRSRTSKSQQKRNGLHQKQTSHFMKTYWPYIPLFLLVGVIVIIAGGLVLGPFGAVVGSTSVVVAGLAILL